ncbi:MAG TPA: cell division protein FtsL [Bacillota bacterium]|nr:cell division protein FtsL [Bacillota bacterium]HUM56729.1 cell division protein FtsL [Bacillota bacterium]
MITAEQWYEQQTNYTKYGFDMKPRASSERPGNSSGVTVADRKRLMFLVVVAGLICIGIIISSAYAASVAFTNNQLKEQNAALQSEVETLEIKIQSANNIRTIEEKATGELGMVYPEGEQYVVLSGEEKTADDFGSLLKKQAFQ